MKNIGLSLLVATLLIHTSAVHAQLSDDEYRMCGAAGDMAQGALALRYSGLDIEETNEYLDEGREGFRNVTGIKLETMISEAYQRPYRRSSSEQSREAADFGRVYYEGCIQIREYNR